MQTMTLLLTKNVIGGQNSKLDIIEERMSYEIIPMPKDYFNTVDFLAIICLRFNFKLKPILYPDIGSEGRHNIGSPVLLTVLKSDHKILTKHNFKPLQSHQFCVEALKPRITAGIKITKQKLTAQADGTLFDILFFSVVILLPLNLGELVREGVSLDAALRRAAIVLGHGPALLDDAQVVVVTTGTRGLKQERVHHAALDIKIRFYILFCFPKNIAVTVVADLRINILSICSS